MNSVKSVETEKKKKGILFADNILGKYRKLFNEFRLS